jgi:hypothetical protein
MNEDFAQCVLFDGNTSDARMNGIEYIISARVFNNLTAAERKYWHPHDYEILSGELIAPGLPANSLARWSVSQESQMLRNSEAYLPANVSA